MNYSKAIIATVISLLVLFFPTICFWLGAAFANLSLHFLVPIIGIAIAILVGFITFCIQNKIFYKKNIISLVILIIILVGAIAVEDLYKYKYIPSITVGQQSDFYKDYLPFSSSDKLARLDSESSLRFSKDDALPILDGATALFPVYCSFVEAVFPQTSEIERFVKFSKTAGAYKNLLDGKADIIFVAEPSKEQREAAKNLGVEFNFYPIGFEAFVFLVNRKNPVSSLTLAQIKDIYAGKITNWKDLGGKNQAIRPFQRDANSGSQSAFLALMGKDAALLPPETHEVIGGMGDLVEKVSDYQNHSNAIGYSFRYYVSTMKNDVGIKILDLNGIKPTKENIINGSYPASGNFYAVTIRGKESENTKKFVDWILSVQGQALIEKVGYVPLSTQ